MALATVVTTTHFTNYLETNWSPRLLLDATEEMEIASNFMQGSDLDVQKMGNLLYVRKVAVKTANKVAGTVALDSEALTMEADTETAVSVSPQFAYCAATYSEQVQQRLMAYPKLEKAVRTQFLRALTERIDLDAGALASDLSQSVSDVNISAALIRQALGVLRAGAKREFTFGKTPAFLRIHSSQAQHLFGIAEITSANLRGDSDNPNVTGMLVQAWGTNVAISDNIESEGGNRRNMLFVKPAFALVYNAEPQLEPPQREGLATIVSAFADYGVAEIYDAYAVQIQTVA